MSSNALRASSWGAPVTRKFLVLVASACTVVLSAVVVAAVIFRPQTEWRDHIQDRISSFERRVEAELDAIKQSIKAAQIVDQAVKDVVDEAVKDKDKDEK